MTKKRSRKIADKQDNQSNNYDNKNNELSDRETVSQKNGKKVCNITQHFFNLTTPKPFENNFFIAKAILLSFRTK